MNLIFHLIFLFLVSFGMIGSFANKLYVSGGTHFIYVKGEYTESSARKSISVTLDNCVCKYFTIGCMSSSVFTIKVNRI